MRLFTIIINAAVFTEEGERKLAFFLPLKCEDYVMSCVKFPRGLN